VYIILAFNEGGGKRYMKPLIGISAGLKENTVLSLHKINYEKISENGGLPIVLPNVIDNELLQAFAEKLDGLLLTGGGDIDPILFGEEPHKDLGEVSPMRDHFEINLTEEMLDLDKPVLGICRGSQVLSVATGGTIYQDIYAQKRGGILQHKQKAPREHASHFVQIAEDSLLYAIVKTNQLKVNTFHHQAIKDVGKNIQISSRANDGVIEAIESNKNAFALGVQWHPEFLNDAASQSIFKAFIGASLTT